MIKQQENILANYLKTIGFIKTSGNFSYFNAIEETTNRIAELKKDIEEIKVFKKEDKAKLIASQAYLSQLKDENAPEGLYLDNVKITKKLQEEYNKSLKYYKKGKEDLRFYKAKLIRLNREQEEIKHVTFDFGPDVREETGDCCILNGCESTDAYMQVNPLAASLHEDFTKIMICDRCANLLAEEI